VLANQFTEADTALYLNALIEIGLVLFVITLIVNSLSRLLIWEHGEAGPAHRACRGDSSRGVGGVTRTQRRKLASSLFVGFCGLSVLIALVPLGFVLFYVLREGIQSLNVDSSRSCRSRSGRRAAAWPTRLSATLIMTGLGSLFAVPIASSAASTCQSTPAPASRRSRGSRRYA